MKESESAHLTRAERIAILAAVIRGVVAGCVEEAAHWLIDTLTCH